MARRCPPRLHFRRLDTLTCTWQLFGKTIEQFDSPVNGAQDRRSIGVVPWVRHAAKKGGLHFAAFLTPYPLAFHTLAHSFALFFALSCTQKKPAKPGPSILATAPLPAATAPAPGKASPQLYSPLRRSPLAGSRQEYPADPQRLVSHRESPRRQPRLSRLDARVSSSGAPGLGVPGRSEQFYPADCLVPHRNAHSAFLWNLHSRCAGRRWSHRHFQRLGHAEKQRGDGPGPGGSEESELGGHLSQRVLSPDIAAHCRPWVDLHGHHPRGERASPPGAERPRHSRRGDRVGAHGTEHLSLLWLCRSPRRDHRRERDEHHPQALLLPPRLYRRPDSLERRKRLASFSARSRGLRLPRRACCIMEFHHRDETRSLEFHCVPQLSGRIISQQRCLARGRAWSHYDRQPRVPRLRCTIRDSQRCADSPACKPSRRQTPNGLAICRGVDTLERSSPLL